jgi:hypothetical protein
VIGVAIPTDPACTETPFVLCPAGTVMLVGAGKAVGLLLCTLTVVPPAGATPLSVTLSVANAPVETLDGVIEIEVKASPLLDGITVTMALLLELP